MARLIKKKLNGSTLIEVLIAMVIIVVVFTIAMQLFSNVMRSGVSSTKVKVDHQMRLLADEVKDRGRIEEEQIVLDSIRYELKVLPSLSNELSQLEITATQGERKLSVYRCLLTKKYEED